MLDSQPLRRLWASNNLGSLCSYHNHKREAVSNSPTAHPLYRLPLLPLVFASSSHIVACSPPPSASSRTCTAPRRVNAATEGTPFPVSCTRQTTPPAPRTMSARCRARSAASADGPITIVRVGGARAALAYFGMLCACVPVVPIRRALEPKELASRPAAAAIRHRSQTSTWNACQVSLPLREGDIIRGVFWYAVRVCSSRSNPACSGTQRTCLATGSSGERARLKDTMSSMLHQQSRAEQAGSAAARGPRGERARALMRRALGPAK